MSKFCQIYSVTCQGVLSNIVTNQRHVTVVEVYEDIDYITYLMYNHTRNSLFISSKIRIKLKPKFNQFMKPNERKNICILLAVAVLLILFIAHRVLLESSHVDIQVNVHPVEEKQSVNIKQTTSVKQATDPRKDEDLPHLAVRGLDEQETEISSLIKTNPYEGVEKLRDLLEETARLDLSDEKLGMSIVIDNMGQYKVTVSTIRFCTVRVFISNAPAGEYHVSANHTFLFGKSQGEGYGHPDLFKTHGASVYIGRTKHRGRYTDLNMRTDTDPSDDDPEVYLGQLAERVRTVELFCMYAKNHARPQK